MDNSNRKIPGDDRKTMNQTEALKHFRDKLTSELRLTQIEIDAWNEIIDEMNSHRRGDKKWDTEELRRLKIEGGLRRSQEVS